MTRTEWTKIAMLLLAAIIMLAFVVPGMQESPYNEF